MPNSPNYIPREVTESVVAEVNDLIVCMVGGITVRLPEHPSDGDMVKVATQNTVNDVAIVPSSGDTILGESSFIIGYSHSSAEFLYSIADHSWRIITPQITGIQGDVSTIYNGYVSKMVSENYTAAAHELVICLVPDLEITLPNIPPDGSAVKIATQEAGGAKIKTAGNTMIENGYVYFLNAEGYVELVYDASADRWVVVSASGSSSPSSARIYDDANSCMAHKTNVRTREEFKDWIYRKLGWPLVSIELTDEMLDDCINDAILELSEYAYQNRKFYAFDLTEYKEDEGIEMPLGVTVINRVSSNIVGPNAVGAGKIDNYMNDLIANGAIGFPLLGRPAGSGWVNYELAMSYLNLSQKMLGGDYDWNYDPRTRILELYPDPIKTKQDKGWIVVECNCLRKDDQQFGDNWVKRMALAQAKIVLGRVRSKFVGVNLPGGGQINADDRQEGITERDNLTVELHDRYPVATMFLM